jgi:hypothetical protein
MVRRSSQPRLALPWHIHTATAPVTGEFRQVIELRPAILTLTPVTDHARMARGIPDGDPLRAALRRHRNAALQEVPQAHHGSGFHTARLGIQRGTILRAIGIKVEPKFSCALSRYHAGSSPITAADGGVPWASPGHAMEKASSEESERPCDTLGPRTPSVIRVCVVVARESRGGCLRCQQQDAAGRGRLWALPG